MLRAFRPRLTGRAGRLMILLLALSLWPMATFGASDCCPDAEAAVEVATMSDCHEPVEASTPHTGCDAECAARCAAPTLFATLALAPAQVHPQQPRAPWHASVPPRPQGARLLRPPIHA